MKTLDEVRAALRNYGGRRVKIMEVCGTHTAAIFRHGIRDILSPNIELVSGPGCPVCVTGEGYIDRLVGYSLADGACVLAFGDMMRVPGSSRSLSQATAAGGRAEIFYSPFAVLEKAKASPETLFVVAAVGFETTTPLYALLLERIIREKIANIRFLVSLKTIIPALDFICRNENGIDAFLCPGHVSVVTGSAPYRALAEKYEKPFVIGGFTGEHILACVYEILAQLGQKRCRMANLYKSAVSEAGNANARALTAKYFEPKDEYWRGIGVIENSGLRLRDEYAAFDAGSGIDFAPAAKNGCVCADVIMGRKSPAQCALFSKQCTPGRAVGPCMVSAEGACGVWYHNLKE